MKSPVAALAAVCAAAAFAAPAEAAYVVNIEEVGSSVIGTGSGSIDLTALTILGIPRIEAPRIFPSPGIVALGLNQDPLPQGQFYTGVSGPVSLGGFGFSNPFADGSGPSVGIVGAGQELFVPKGYVSGTPLGTSTLIYTGGFTIANLGLTPGTSVWTWGSGADADSFTLNIGVPEPATWAMLILGVAMVGFTARRRRQAAPFAA